MNIKSHILVVAIILNGIGTAALWADDSAISAVTAAPAVTAPATNPTSPKHHHKHTKTPPAPATVINSPAPISAPTAPQVGASAGSTEMPGLYQNRGAGAVGGPNRGVGDHIAGTSGTSGQ